jgi:PAS domain S-box-containing protein
VHKAFQESPWLQASPCALAIGSLPDGKFIEVNREFETIFGYSQVEVLGKTAAQIGLWVNPADLSEVLRDLETGNPARDHEAILRAKSGDEKICRFSCIKIDLAGKPCVVMFVQDISEQKRAEELLKASEERFRKAFHDSHIGMALTDSAGFFHDVNRALCETLGYTRDELLKLNYLDLTHPEDQAGCKENYGEVISGHPGPHVHQKRYLRKNGEIIWLRASASRILDSEGRLLYGLCVIEDITGMCSHNSNQRNVEKHGGPRSARGQ